MKYLILILLIVSGCGGNEAGTESGNAPAPISKPDCSGITFANQTWLGVGVGDVLQFNNTPHETSPGVFVCGSGSLDKNPASGSLDCMANFDYTVKGNALTLNVTQWGGLNPACLQTGIHHCTYSQSGGVLTIACEGQSRDFTNP